MIELICGDAVEVMAGMEAGSVDLVAVDPPYHRQIDAAWDRQWATDADYLAWLGLLLEQFERLLRFNGSLYLFASPRMAARVEVLVGGRFNVLNSITWVKHDGTSNRGGLWSRATKEDMRSFFPQTERIIFAEHYGADNNAKGEAGYERKCDELRGFVFEPLRAWFAAEKARAGVGSRQIMDYFESHGWPKYVTARHTFSTSQWELPTAENYERLRQCFHELAGSSEYLRKDYEYLRKDYEELRKDYEELRRPFSVTADVPYTDVWDFATVQSYEGKHPCEKPAALCEHIVRTSTRPGDTVLDCCMGSGSMLRAADGLGRDGYGIDADPHWVEYARRNIAKPRQMQLLDLPKKQPTRPAPTQSAMDLEG